jgi:hypothetical protein
VTTQSIRLKTTSSSVSVSAHNSNALSGWADGMLRTLKEACKPAMNGAETLRSCFTPLSGSADSGGDWGAYFAPKEEGKRQLSNEKKKKVAMPVNSIKAEGHTTMNDWETVNDDVKDPKAKAEAPEDVVAVSVEVLADDTDQANIPFVPATSIDG